MARKRKLDANLPDQTPSEDMPELERKSAMGGMWGGSAMNMLKQRIEEAHGSIHSGIMAGTVALELDPQQIRDSVGSDRMDGWWIDPDFDALVANIKRRGQMQPIRVRPAKADWVPDISDPLKTSDTFYIQSGRRRLEACKLLERPVLAIVSTVAGDQALADLEERFHENTMRRDLNGFEELISIGLLAESLKNFTQTEIAERLGVGQGDVSLGLACLEHRGIILDRVDISKTPKRQYRTIIPKLKKGERLDAPQTTNDAKAGDGTFEADGVRIVTRQTGSGYNIALHKTQVAQDDLENMLKDIASVVAKYRDRSNS